MGLGLGASAASSLGLIPGWETKILKAMWHSPCFQKVVYGDFGKKKKKVFCNHSRWLAVTRCSDPCFK